MLRYILKRLLYAFITVWVIATLTFLLMKALPGDPFNDPKLKPEVKQALMDKYKLNEPVLKQYGIYLNNLIHGDLGTSIKFPGRSVTTIIKTSFPKSFALGWRAMLLASTLGIFFGLVAALNHNKWIDYLVIFIAILGVSVPNIVMGPFLSYNFGVKLGWLPVTVDNTARSFILPVITLSLGTLAFVSRMMRTTTLEINGQDYILTAKSKGITKPQVVWKHTIRNAIMPVVTVLGPLFAGIITGSIVVEKVYAVAGLGEYFVNTILSQDYPMIMGITLFYAVLIIASMLIVDIAYGFIDPRLRGSMEGGE
ncbi:ABC transporter permease [Clostridium swellfunianum]|uniref:ABC transporter permease n=1 Tax=Clostridium swellfunianum TaxID=1367462 RepID=UPI0020303353|nr:ABC transporter permease [Clostridium swellfunianum]MCM0647561.1 ABC transporter permease [Clostridium swellfunianum]